MEAVFDIQTLRNTLLASKKIIPNKKDTELEILRSVRLEVREGGARLTAGNLDVTHFAEHPDADAILQGEAALDFTTLDKVIRKLNKRGGQVRIKSQGDDVLVSHVQSSFEMALHKMPIEDFPTVEAFDEPERFVGEVEDYPSAFGQVLPYIREDAPSRKPFIGYAHFNAGESQIEATDGHRAIRHDFVVPEILDGALMHRDGIKLAEYIFRVRADGNIGISRDEDEGWIGLWRGRHHLVLNEIDADYVDLYLLFPSSIREPVEVSVDRFQQAVDTMRSFMPRKHRSLYIDADEDGMELSIPANSNMKAEPPTEKVGRSGRNDQASVEFNPDYIEDMLDTFEEAGEDRVSVYIREPSSPTEFTADSGIDVVIMPRLDR